MTTSPSPRGVDADAWIQQQLDHGHHVVHRIPRGLFMSHPCGSPDGCDFSGREWREPDPDHPAYIAAIDKDGIVGPDHNASWDAVVAHDSGQAVTG